MKNSEDYYMESLVVSKGMEKARLLEKAAELAEQELLPHKAFEYRYDAISALMDNDSNVKTISLFSALLNELDSNKEEFAHWEDDLLWVYKWVLPAVDELPSIPQKKKDALLADYAKRVRANGYTDYSINLYSMLNSVHKGEYEEAEVFYNKVINGKRDSHSDCAACIPGNLVCYLNTQKRYQEAFDLFKSIISGKQSCAHVPSLTWPVISLLALKTGDEKHRKYYASAWQHSLFSKEILKDRDHTVEYIWREGLLADFIQLMKSQFNICGNGKGLETKRDFLIQVEAALYRFEADFKNVDFDLDLDFNGEKLKSWADFKVKCSAEVENLCKAFDERINKSIYEDYRQEMLEEAKSLQSKKTIMELSSEASNSSAEIDLKVDTVKSESFESVLNHYFEQSYIPEGWEASLDKIKGLSNDELLELVQEDSESPEGYAAMVTIKGNEPSYHFALALWLSMYGDDWNSFGVRCLQHFSQDINALKAFMPELLRWRGTLSSYAIRRILDIAKGKDRSWALFTQARLWEGQDDQEENIVKNLKVIQVADLDDDSDLFEYGMLLKRFSFYDQAILVFKQLINEGRLNDPALLQLGYTYADQGEWELAKTKLYEYLATAQEPTSYAKDQLAMVLRQLQEHEESLRYALEAAEDLEDDFDVQLQAGMAYYILENFDDAIPYLMNAHKIYEEDLFTIERLGLALRFSGKYEDAIKYFKKALKLQPESVDGISFSIACCELSLGKAVPAEKKLIKLIESKSSLSEACLEILEEQLTERRWQNLLNKFADYDAIQQRLKLEI